IGAFIITSESAVAAGVRRIEALTGAAAIRFLNEKLQESKMLVELLKTKNPIKTIEKLIEDKAALEKKIEALEANEAAAMAKTVAEQAEHIHGTAFIGAKVAANSVDALKEIALEQKQYHPEFVAVLVADIQGKAAVTIAMDEQTAANRGLDAGQIIKQQVAALIKGGGGGQKTLANAGGQDRGGLEQVMPLDKALLCPRTA